LVLAVRGWGGGGIPLAHAASIAGRTSREDGTLARAAAAEGVPLAVGAAVAVNRCGVFHFAAHLARWGGVEAPWALVLHEAAAGRVTVHLGDTVGTALRAGGGERRADSGLIPQAAGSGRAGRGGRQTFAGQTALVEGRVPQAVLVVARRTCGEALRADQVTAEGDGAEVAECVLLAGGGIADGTAAALAGGGVEAPCAHGAGIAGLLDANRGAGRAANG